MATIEGERTLLYMNVISFQSAETEQSFVVNGNMEWPLRCSAPEMKPILWVMAVMVVVIVLAMHA